MNDYVLVHFFLMNRTHSQRINMAFNSLPKVISTFNCAKHRNLSSYNKIFFFIDTINCVKKYKFDVSHLYNQ